MPFRVVGRVWGRWAETATKGAVDPREKYNISK